VIVMSSTVVVLAADGQGRRDGRSGSTTIDAAGPGHDAGRWTSWPRHR
jgi:hypothetical protein